MEIRIFDGDIKTSEAQREYIIARVGTAANRLKDAAFVIDVRLTDLNGPKGGIDKRCSIHATPPGGSPVVAEKHAPDYYAAIDAAAAVFKRSLAKSLEKVKSNGPR